MVKNGQKKVQKKYCVFWDTLCLNLKSLVLNFESQSAQVEEEDFNCCNGPNMTHPMCFPIGP